MIPCIVGAALFLRRFPVRRRKCNMPESRRGGIKLDPHQKASMNALRRACHAASDPHPAICMFQNKPRIRGEILGAHQQRPVIVDVRRMRLNYFRPAGDTYVKFHGDSQHHSLAAPALIVRRQLRAVILYRIFAAHACEPASFSGIRVRAQHPATMRPVSTIPIPKNPSWDSRVLLPPPSRPPFCFPCKPQPRQSTAGLPGW